ncbi:putative transcription factor interactor and regulator CCHC(Zn) family [Helianthus anomalus]
MPKAEVRKQYGNQKLPYQQKQNHANQGKRKGKRAQNKKKFQKINFMKSRGTDKFETFKNKSNMNFVKQRRSCFECGEYGHIVKNCPYLTKGKGKVDAPYENLYRSRSVSPKQDFQFQKERKLKQKRKQRKEVGKVLKPKVVQTQSVKPNVKNEKKKQIWKPKTVTVSGRVQSIPNHLEMEVTILDDVRRPKSMKAWVPLSN